ncbi:MAG: Xylose isomerase [Verrucomicrobia bacterium]|nr:Xylose isomerase [Verrucomicrobiota bacterium]
MPSIAHIANLWSLVNHPSAARQWSLEKKIKACAAAGFDGITTALTPEHRRLAEKSGLKHLLGFVSTSSGDPKDFATRIRAQKESGAVQINVQLDDDDTPPALATKHWIQMMREAEKIGGVVLSLEVHRDCCTETPEKTYEIAERYEKATGEMIRINFDFSHFAVVKHLAPANYAERLLAHPALVQNSDQSHCRPFNGHHCQVPVTYRGALTDEVKSYLAFCVALFTCWKASPKNRDRTLFVCPEMGPYHEGGGGYNITGLPPSWPDAVVLRGELAKAWKRA